MTYQEPRNLKEIITEIRNFYNLEELKKFLNLVEIPLIPYSIFLAIFFEIIKDGIRGNYGFLVILFLSFSITIIFGSILLYYCLSRKNILASFFGFGVFLIPLALILFNPASAFSIIEGSLVIVILFLTMTTVGLIVSIIKVFEKRLSHFFQNGWRYFISIFNSGCLSICRIFLDFFPCIIFYYFTIQKYSLETIIISHVFWDSNKFIVPEN